MDRYQDEVLQEPATGIAAEPWNKELETLASARAVRRMSRRSFVAASGAAVGVVGLVACGGNGTPAPTATPTPTTAPAPTETDVLNFALNLEYLEASFYLYITTGTGLAATDMGTSPGTVSGGAKVTFTDPNVAALAQQLAADEQAHVEFLRSLITAAKATPVDMPALNLAALGAVTDDASFLATARALETVGTSAYEGGIGAFVSDTAGLAYAATIHDTEGQHEGTLRQFCIAKSVTSPAVDSNDIPPTSTAVFNTNSNGLNAVRTPSQVLQIVYAAAGQTGVSLGGFYPKGMNGNIKTS